MENTGYKISIIMPVYNVERYLADSLESVIGQSLSQVEIIAVNDGSTDSSLKILEEYQSKCPDRLRVYTTENHGVSHARNYGLGKATGEYIQFVDSDDFIEPAMCEKLYHKAVKGNHDIVICGRYNVYEREHIGQQEKEITGTNLINSSFRLRECRYELAHISPFPWDKLFKRSILDGLEFPEKMRFEDIVLVYEACCRAESIGVVEEPLYNYRRTAQGGFLNSFSVQTLDIIKAFRLVFDFMESNHYMEYYHDELEYICARHFLYRYAALFKEGNKGKLGIKLDIIRETQEFLDRETPQWRKNHYLKYSSESLRGKLPLYTNKRRMIVLTWFQEIMPGVVWKLIPYAGRVKRKWARRLRIWNKSTNKLALVKNKLPFLAVMKQDDSIYYTKLYEKLPIAQKDILLESKHGTEVAGNIFALLTELDREDYRSYRVMLALEKSAIAQFRPLLEHYQIKRVKIIELRSKAYLKALACAGYLVTDTSFPPYFIKKEGQVYLNTWHGTPLKAMGRIVPQREFALGNVQRNFLISDYLLYQNEFSKDVFLRDYMIKDIYRGKVLLSGYPRNAAFFGKDRYAQIRAELRLEDKQVIAYMPTWRGLLHKKDTDLQLEQLKGYFKEIDQRLAGDQVMYVKLHPYVGDQIQLKGYRHIKRFPRAYETYDFLNASDVLVTDYSSVMFDYGVTKRKIILFTYDRRKYLDGRGIYLDLEALELPKADTVEELVKELKQAHKDAKLSEGGGALKDAEMPESEGASEDVKMPESKGASEDVKMPEGEGAFEDARTSGGYYPQFYERFCSLDAADTPARVCGILLSGHHKEAIVHMAGEELSAAGLEQEEMAQDRRTSDQSKLDRGRQESGRLKSDRLESSRPDERKRVLIFINGLEQDDRSNRLIQSINSIDTSRYDVYVCMKANHMVKASGMLSLFREEINYIPITFEINYTGMDYILCRLRMDLGLNLRVLNRRIDHVMRRESRKYFGDTEFDIVIHQSDLDRMVSSMCRQLGRTTVYNFKYFNYQKYKADRGYRKKVDYTLDQFSSYTMVVATKEYNLLSRKADNLFFNEDKLFPFNQVLEEVKSEKIF